uniref:Activator of basal transcription 1 n=1 Tax=Strigamia maritima TaxID=126957 RepID=T1JGM3_STRMM
MAAESEPSSSSIELVESTKPERKIESGIIYLSTIPPTMNVKTIRQFFSKFGQTGNIFLKPNRINRPLVLTPWTSKKSMYYFTEGWIEFKNKKIAKRVASSLHNTQVGGKRRHKYYDSLWNIKYLHKLDTRFTCRNLFRWIHLNERLAHEKATHDQRMRAEIAQVKRETNHYVKSVETSKRLKRLETRIRKEGKSGKIHRRLRFVKSRLKMFYFEFILITLYSSLVTK